MSWFFKAAETLTTVLLHDSDGELHISRVWKRGNLLFASAGNEPGKYLLKLLPGGRVEGKSYVRTWEPLENPSEELLALYNEKS